MAQQRVFQETPRTLYLANLTLALYTFYGGDSTQIAALETPEDRYTDRWGKLQRKREHYPLQPAVSVETCRTLAERILDEGAYNTAMAILQWHDKRQGQQQMQDFLGPYIERLDNLELRRVSEFSKDSKKYTSDLEEMVA